jgi:hypothetical protein
MEDVMENQSLYTDEEQHTASRAGHARKLLKREQRLLERLQKAQEAEARALDRFRRTQARVQRRKARLERIKNHLSLVRKQIADLQIAGLQVEPIEPAPVITSTPEPAAMWDSEVIAPAQTEPEPVPTSDSETAISSTSEPEVVSTSDSTSDITAATPETEPASLSDAVTAAPDRIEQEVDVTRGPVAEDEQEVVMQDSGGQPSDSTPESEPATPPVSEQESQPTTVPSPQDVVAAKEAWLAAEAAVQDARNTAHGIAASISFLSQTGGLSSELMDELLRKQSEANKALGNAQNAARAAYEKFVQAQEAAQDGSNPPARASTESVGSSTQQNQENGASSVEDNVADQTAQMHAVRLYKAW